MLATSAPPYKLQELLVPRGDCSTPARQTPLGFGIVGVQKGGTTGLTSHISHHPDLCIAIEARVLGVADWSERRGLEWRGASQCGSLCPRLRGLDDPGGSFAFAFAPNRGARVLTEMASRRIRLVLLVREPIQRAYSAYSMLSSLPSSRHRRTYTTFDRCVEEESRWLESSRPVAAQLNTYLSVNEYVRPGLYSEQVDAMLRAGYDLWSDRNRSFDDQNASPQLLLLVSERLHANLEHGLSRLWSFLGVAPAATVSTFDRPGKYRSEPSLAASRKLWRIYNNSNARLYATLGAPVAEWEAYYERRDLRQGQTHIDVSGGAQPRGGKWHSVPALLTAVERWPSLQFAVQLDTDAVLHVAEEGGIEAVFEALRTRSLTHLAHRGATPDDTAVEVARSQVNATVITSLARSCGLPPGLCNENRHVANLHCACIMLWRLDAHGRELLRRWMSESLDDREPHYRGGACFTREQDAFNRVARADRMRGRAGGAPPGVVALPADLFEDVDPETNSTFQFPPKGGCDPTWWQHNRDAAPSLGGRLAVRHRQKSMRPASAAAMPTLPDDVKWSDVLNAIEPFDYSSLLRRWTH